MRTNRLTLLVVMALACGGAASALSVRVLRSAAAEATAVTPMAVSESYVVAVRDLVSGERLSSTDMVLRRGEGAAPAGAVTELGGVAGRIVTQRIAAGDPIPAGALVADPAAVGLPGSIPAGLRGVSVRIDDVAGVSGFALPGTRVDVLAALPSEDASSVGTARLILQNVRVLAVGQEAATSTDGQPQTATVATLLVSPVQAERLVLAVQRGRIQLALRGAGDDATVTTTGIDAAGLASGGSRTTLSLAPAGRRPAGSGSQTVSAPRGGAVEVYNGTARTVVGFQE